MLGGYFHQDFVALYGTPEAAAAAFVRDATPAERRRVARQLRALLARASTLEEVQESFAALPSGWRPRSRAAVEAVLSVVHDDTSAD
jgi:hypothetical protein